MTIKEKMLLESKAWALEKLSLDKNYFDTFSSMPAASIFWIGSLDNLISVREVTNTEPGEILVHRNLASQVRSDDISLLAAIEYAIEMCSVDYIIICGYSQCRGIREVIRGFDDKKHVQKWLEDLLTLYSNHAGEVASMSQANKEKRLCELNIRQQILNLSNLDIVQKAWEKGSSPVLLGWYFDMTTGHIKEIFSMSANESLKQVARVLE